MNLIRSVLDISLSISIEVEDGITFARCECPVDNCTHTTDSADNGLGADHAADVTAGKIATHLKLAHGYKDVDSEKS